MSQQPPALTLPPIVEIDGVRRPTVNSAGRPIHPSPEGVRAFWEWFDDSQAVDAHGRPLVLYHGTGREFSEFRDLEKRNGFYFAENADYADLFAEGDSQNIITAYLSIRNPADLRGEISFEMQLALRKFGYQRIADLRFSSPRSRWEFFDGDSSLRDALQAAGYDGARMVEPDPGTADNGTTSWLALHANQIKSALGNNGRFDPTDAAEFKAWFGHSKVVDGQGQPLVVYHGTKYSFGSFDPSHSIFDDGSMFFSSGPATAEQYARSSSGRARNGMNIMPVYLALQRPLVMDFKGESDIDGLMDAREQAIADGRDGVIALNVDDGYGVATQYVAFRPEQIKSAIGNNGRFDPENADITRSVSRAAEPDDEDDPALPAPTC